MSERTEATLAEDRRFGSVYAALAASAVGVRGLRVLQAFDERLTDLRARSERGPLAVDISDYSDEFCAGFLAGQAHALDEVMRDV